MTEERRVVTVLFADVVGSTALSEHLDPEDLRTLLARFYATAREVIGVHAGTLEKFIGDAVMAVFGLPQAHGDDAERALSAALELRDRVRGDLVLGSRLAIRIGVNTGEVVATRDPSADDFLVTGDAVNIAARLQQAAEPWMILCGERTTRAAARRFAFGSAIEIAAKGKQQAVRALPLVSRPAAAVPLRVPLVGRDADLGQLELVARRAFSERRPFLISLTAPAGTGKTRLLEEFLDRLPDLVPQTTVAIAQCLPYGQRLTYWPLRAVLFRLVGQVEDTPPGIVLAAVRTWLERHGVPGSDRVAALLGATVGLGEAEVIDQSALFAAWRTAIETAARGVPLVLVFEDLHWSSDSLLDLAEFIMQPRGDAPILMIDLARPELFDRRPAWGGGRRNFISLSLEPLSDGAVGELVRHLLGADVPEIVHRVVARAEGNPFYAGEIVRSVLERVPSLRDPAAVEQALAALPDTVQATVLARLDLLPPPERRVLQLGAVFGRTFRAPGIAALEPDVVGNVEHLADGLIARDLIRPSDADRFTFRHILIREVAYSTLPRVERARLHALAGRWLESTAAGRESELAELIAYHYREAALLHSALRTGDQAERDVRRKAVHWLTRAADAATTAAAFVEAARHLRGAVDLAEPDILPDLYEDLGDVTWGNAGVEAYRTALQLCREAGRPPDQELRVLGSLLTLNTRWGGTIGHRPPEEEIIGLRAQGRALLDRTTDERASATFLIGEAFFPFWRAGAGAEAPPAELAGAETSARRGLEIAEHLDDARLRSAALDALGSLATVRGTYEDIRQAARQRLGFQDRLDLGERTDAHAMAAWASALLGDLIEVARVTAAGLGIVQPGQASSGALHIAAWRTYGLMLSGAWDDAIATADHARQLRAESGILSTGFAGHGFIAALDIARARLDNVRTEQYREVLEEILRNFADSSPIQRWRPYLTLDVDAVAAWIHGFELRPSSNPAFLERPLSLCADRSTPLDPEVLRKFIGFAIAHKCLILEGQARRALGLSLQDPEDLTRALSIFERTYALPYVARVRCERALLTGDQTELVAGLKVLEGLGDHEQSARIDQARRR